MVLKECNISPDDTSSWAKDIRTIIKYSIEHFDEMYYEDEEEPDEQNRIISGQLVGDSIELRGEAHGTAGLCVPFTFEEEKAYYIKEENWEDYLVSIGMTEAEYKSYKGCIEWDISGLSDNAQSPYIGKAWAPSPTPSGRPASVEQHHGGVQLFFFNNFKN